ncbi:hypothetical protein [Jiangella rhizosphaerae]|uniref:YiaAB two helix domain-containing protein n=1 Tax=Jiangella rhizosphaerae TaxID=2293569 RepID=A0A418KG73_9ACTN|nr:hypothetical protein [Jiangella rhizosphaerae]RIQ10975.1 hypothetical protein DY240_30475 [Jiangella rhizosphaerae]
MISLGGGTDSPGETSGPLLGLGTIYLVTSAFTLAKCIRDQQEDTALTKRLDQARVDKLIAEHDPFREPV